MTSVNHIFISVKALTSKLNPRAPDKRLYTNLAWPYTMVTMVTHTSKHNIWWSCLSEVSHSDGTIPIRHNNPIKVMNTHDIPVTFTNLVLTNKHNVWWSYLSEVIPTSQVVRVDKWIITFTPPVLSLAYEKKTMFMRISSCCSESTIPLNFKT